MFKPSKISLAVMVLMSTGFSQMSIAQSSGLEEVTITGSNLKRADKEGTSPIQTITAKEIEQSGASSVLQLLKGSAFNGCRWLQRHA
jgi:iron complex outermembrane recepter protein